jgi:hypothetical protein
VAGAVCVVATSGAAAPLVGATIIGGGGLGGFLVGDKVDKEEAKREERLEKNQHYKDTKDELNTAINNNNSTQDAVNTIIGKINGIIPREPNETDDYLKNQLIVLNGQLDNGKKRVNDLRGELDKLRKELSSDSLLSFLGLDKLGHIDKIMIIAGIILVIWLLKG